MEINDIFSLWKLNKVFIWIGISENMLFSDSFKKLELKTSKAQIHCLKIVLNENEQEQILFELSYSIFETHKKFNTNKYLDH